MHTAYYEQYCSQYAVCIAIARSMQYAYIQYVLLLKCSMVYTYNNAILYTMYHLIQMIEMMQFTLYSPKYQLYFPDNESWDINSHLGFTVGSDRYPRDGSHSAIGPFGPFIHFYYGRCLRGRTCELFVLFCFEISAAMRFLWQQEFTRKKIEFIPYYASILQFSRRLPHLFDHTTLF